MSMKYPLWLGILVIVSCIAGCAPISTTGIASTPSASPAEALPSPVAATSTPIITSSQGSIVHDVLILGESEPGGALRIISPDGQESRILLPVQKEASHPEWAHSGDQILYMVSESAFPDELYSFWVVNSDGESAPRQLTAAFSFSKALYGGKWSFDDRYIAFRATDEETDTEDVVVVDVETGETSTRHWSWGYAWSPTESKLAMLSASPAEGLYIVDLETGEEQFFSGVRTANPALAWSPDGLQIAFVDSRTEIRVDRITVLDIASSKYRAFKPQQGLSSRTSRALSWSPDGKHILFQSHMRKKDEVATSAMYVLGVATGMEEKLIEDVEAATWSPDSQEIAYILSINAQKPNQVYKIDVETGEVTQLTDDRYLKEALSWK